MTLVVLIPNVQVNRKLRVGLSAQVAKDMKFMGLKIQMEELAIEVYHLAKLKFQLKPAFPSLDHFNLRFNLLP